VGQKFIEKFEFDLFLPKHKKTGLKLEEHNSFKKQRYRDLFLMRFLFNFFHHFSPKSIIFMCNNNNFS